MSMPEPLSLQLIARLVCVQSLLDLTEGKDVTNFLKTVCHGAVTEDILSHMVKFYPRKLTNEMLAGLASPHIHQLKLANCTQIKPSNFIKIFPHCKHLCGLDLKQCNQLMLGDFFVLMDRMGVNLTSISVEECTTVDDDIVHSILQNLHHLKHLNVSSCKNITDKAFLISQDQLKKRNLLKVSSTHDYFCSLTSIDISGCHGLTNLAIRNLVTLTGPTLEHVCMSWTNLTLESLWCLSGLLVPNSLLGCETEDDGEEDEEVFNNNTKDENVIEARESSSADPKAVNIHSDTSNFLVKSASLPLVLHQQNLDLTECDNCDLKTSESVTPNLPAEANSSIQKDIISNIDSEKVTSSQSQSSITCDDCRKICILDEITVDLNGHSYDETNHEFDKNIAKEIKREESLEDKCNRNLVKNVGSGAVGGITVQTSPLLGQKESDENSVENISEIKEDFSAQTIEPSQKSESEALINCLMDGGKTMQKRETDFKSNSDISESCERCQTTKLKCDLLSTVNQPLSNVPNAVPESDLPCSLKEERTVNMEGRCQNGSDYEKSENLLIESGNESKINLKVSQPLDQKQSTCKSQSEIPTESVQCHMSEQSSVDNFQTLGAENILDKHSLKHSEEKHIQKDFAEVDGISPLHSSNECAKQNEIGADNAEKPLDESNEVLSSASSNALVDLQAHQGSIVDCNSPTHNPISSSSLGNLTMEDSNKPPKHRQPNVDNQSLPPKKQLYKPNIKSIDLEEMHYPNNKQQALEEAFSTFITSNPGLQSLKLSWVKFPNRLLKLMVDTCVEMKDLTLIGCNLIDPEHIRYIGSKCTNLRRIQLEDLRRMTDWGVVPLLSNTEIETLSLAESDIHDVTVIRMASKLSENLKNLNISYCSELTERGINSLLRKQSCVESFSARQGALTNLSLGLLSDNFRQLRSLNIASIEDITGSGLVCLAKNLRHLEFIDLSWAGGSCLQDEVTKAILNHCPRINGMILNGQALMTSKPFLPIISDYNRWSRCKALFFFKAKERAAKEVLQITDEGESSDDEYEEIHFPHRSTTFATNLQSLCLEYCDSITDADMEDIVTVCRGSIAVVDYYSCEVRPKVLTLRKFEVKDLSSAKNDCE